MSFKPELFVAAGVALLDEKVPGWEAKINLDTLDVRRSGCCIIEQLAAAGDSGWDELGMGKIEVASRHGFLADDPGQYALLTAEWKRLIIERRAV